MTLLPNKRTKIGDEGEDDNKFEEDEEYGDYDQDEEEYALYGPLRKRMDIIPRFPFEISATIFAELSTNDLFQCLDVNPKWLYILQKLPDLWYRVVLIDEEYKDVSKLPLIGMHIREFEIGKFACQEILDRVPSQIQTGSMNNLVSLAWESADFIGEDVIMCIKHLKGTLTELKLTHSTDTRYVQPFDLPSVTSILTACSTLEYIEVSELPVENDVEDRDHDDKESLPQELKLVHLHWHPSGRRFTMQEAKYVLTSSPSLEYFSVGGFNGSSAPLSISKKEISSNLSYIDIGSNKGGLPGIELYSDDESDNADNDDDSNNP